VSFARHPDGLPQA